MLCIIFRTRLIKGALLTIFTGQSFHTFLTELYKDQNIHVWFSSCLSCTRTRTFMSDSLPDWAAQGPGHPFLILFLSELHKDQDIHVWFSSQLSCTRTRTFTSDSLHQSPLNHSLVLVCVAEGFWNFAAQRGQEQNSCLQHSCIWASLVAMRINNGKKGQLTRQKKSNMEFGEKSCQSHNIKEQRALISTEKTLQEHNKDPNHYGNAHLACE